VANRARRDVVSNRPPALPWSTRLLLRIALRRELVERAACDLADVQEHVASTRGRAAARRAVFRETVSIVLWSLFDRARRLREPGEAKSMKADSRRRFVMVRDFGQDLRFGVRALARRPGFTMITLVVLALGIGANATIYTLAHRLFLEQPAEVAAPERLVRVFRTSGSFAGGSLSYPDYRDYREGASSLAGLAASSSPTVTAARSGKWSAQVRVGMVSENYFDVLGVRPAAGRFFLGAENRVPDADPVAVVSWVFWQERLGGEPDVVGREVLLNGRPFTIVGVTPRGFRGFEPAAPVTEVFIPILMRTAILPTTEIAWRERVEHVRENWLLVIGRLRDGATVAGAQAELATIAARIYPPEPDRDPQSVLVTSHIRWNPVTHSSLARLTRLLAATVAVLLAVAAANAAVLLLARASTRSRELGIRVTLGASRIRVLRELLTESVLLGVAGGAIGLLLALAGARMAGTLLPVRLDPPPSPSGSVLMVTALISVMTALLAGTAPAVRAARADVAGMIHGRTRHAGGTRLRDGLVVLQVALSLVLITGATLFARSLMVARAVDVGFDTRNTLLVRTDLSTRGYDAERGRAFIREALGRLADVPGVNAATVSRQAPFRGEWSTTLRAWPGASFAGGAVEADVGLNVVGAGYFDALGIPVLRGRAIEESDDERSTPVVVVNETFARTILPEGDAVGHTVPLRGPDQPSHLIVGVVRDATYYEFAEQSRLQAYGPVLQMYMPQLTFVVKTAVDPTALVRPVQDALHALDPDLALTNVETLESVYAEQLAGYRTSASVVGLTGLIALLLASAGLYGVMAYRVAERTREIGVRMALGATRRTVARGVLVRALRLTLAGVTLGLAGAFVLGRFVQALLFSVSAYDTASFLIAPLVLSAVAAAATLVPARRAMAIDPMRAIRTE
jgi:predicted permease